MKPIQKGQCTKKHLRDSRPDIQVITCRKAEHSEHTSHRPFRANQKQHIRNHTEYQIRQDRHHDEPCFRHILCSLYKQHSMAQIKIQRYLFPEADGMEQLMRNKRSQAQQHAEVEPGRSSPDGKQTASHDQNQSRKDSCFPCQLLRVSAS